MKKITLTIFVIFILVTGFFLLRPKNNPEIRNQVTSENIIPEVKEKSEYVLPVKNFKEGITKKPFGIYITPKNSPVAPEKFQGFYTGVDIEETQGEIIPVLAIADGEVIYSGWVVGYGGVLGLKIDKYLVLYGHLNADTIPKVGTKVVRGQQLGYLGKGNTKETDFERQHLHFGILKSGRFDLRGYVQSQNDLENWLNPANFF